jgi:signal transduction histidine kinase
VSGTTAENYAGILSQRVAQERQALAGRWLDQLEGLLTVPTNDVFPSQQLLDHIPSLIGEIAGYLRAPADEEIAANAAVIDKARELGLLRHQQHASVHQLLREYDILGQLLEAFVAEETERLGLRPSAAECFEVVRRVTHAVRTLMRTTVDTFVLEYTSALEERNERIGAFNRMASHELRSPIGTLLFASAALNIDTVRSDPARLARVAAAIKTNAERLSWLVTNLQRLARLDDRLDPPNHQHVELGTIAMEVGRQLADMAAAHGVVIECDPHLPMLHGDQAQIELVLINLISNAIKYSDRSKARSFVEIAASNETSSDGSVTICVRDNGIGIPDADQSAIFDRFFRAHPNRDDELGVTGTGLGLAIVAECLRALGGSIRCESVVGQGTTFFVTLPSQPPASSS